jgi:hypothetical protein
MRVCPSAISYPARNRKFHKIQKRYRPSPMEPISAFKFINFNFEGIEAEVLYRKRPSAGQAKTHLLMDIVWLHRPVDRTLRQGTRARPTIWSRLSVLDNCLKEHIYHPSGTLSRAPSDSIKHTTALHALGGESLFKKTAMGFKKRVQGLQTDERRRHAGDAGHRIPPVAIKPA